MAAAGGGYVLHVDQKQIQVVAKAMRAELDGKELRKDLIRTMKAAAAPMVTDLKAAIAMPGAAAGPSITAEVARAIKPTVRLAGRDTGVGVKAGNTSVRGFRKAAKAFNLRGWRHPVYGGPAWVAQTGRPGWFDTTTAGHRDALHAAVMTAVEDMARRIAARSRS